MVYIYIILVVFLFGMLIALHEFGHFITAKRFGVRVNEFSIGMGPAIFKKQIGETLYALRIVPLGGYCAMEGEDEDTDDVPLMAGDTIVRIDDYNVYLINDFFLQLERGENKPFYDITVLRNGEEVFLDDVRLEQREVIIDGEKQMKYGLNFAIEESTFTGKTKYVFQNAYNLVRLVKVSLVDLITGRAGVNDLSGPVGIGTMMVDTAKQSMPSLWYLLALVSINLGIMNLLPIPALDGGRLFFMLIELIRRKPINPKYESWVHAAGVLLLIALMLFVTFNDIVKLFAGG